jgi:hypothetical protein
MAHSCEKIGWRRNEVNFERRGGEAGKIDRLIGHDEQYVT